MKTDKIAQDLFDVKAKYNEWLNELTLSEISLIFEMFDEYAEAYHKSKMAEITDDDIEKYFSEFELANRQIAFGQELSDIAIGSAVIGATAMRNGEIKHT